MTIIEKILALIQNSVDEFNKSIPQIQKDMFGELILSLMQLKTRQGNILSNVENLRLIGNIRNRLEGIILNAVYSEEVDKFINAFELLTGLQVEYFAQFNKKFTPGKTLSIIQDLAIEATANSLTAAGISAYVIDPVHDILRINVTSGASVAELQEGLRQRIIGNQKELGGLEKYTRQITTDALNQYSAQYQQAVSEDLGFEWRRYVGSNLTTTREFCKHMTKKEFFHVSEIPEIIKGRINGLQCKIYAKTGLPHGMIPGTNQSNFDVFRGGYNCGHQAFAVPAATVPATIVSSLKIE